METQGEKNLRAFIRDLKRKQIQANSKPDVNDFDYWMKNVVKSKHYGTYGMILARQRLI